MNVQNQNEYLVKRGILENQFNEKQQAIIESKRIESKKKKEKK